jgi:hypothetical protein
LRKIQRSHETPSLFASSFLPAMTAEARFDTDASSVAKIKVRKCRLGDEFLHDEP